MATTKFQREPKMMTTEPSVDEVGLKKGGKAKKMQMGGAAMAQRPMAGRAAMLGTRGSMAPAQRAALLSKKGGEVESKSEEKREDRKIQKVEKELKHHEGMKAKKAHHGLKKGGAAAMAKDNTPGGLLGGLEATRSNKKKTSGNIELTGYKKGGTALAAKGDRFQAHSAMKPKIDVQDKVNDASKYRTAGNKTGSVKNTIAGAKVGGYKKGGTVSQNVASRYVNDMQDGENKAVKKSTTGNLAPRQYKKGGHVSMTCKNEGGFTQMKKMAKC